MSYSTLSPMRTTTSPTSLLLPFIVSNTDATIDGRTLTNRRIRLQWTNLTTKSMLIYTSIALLTTIYYAVCFGMNFGYVPTGEYIGFSPFSESCLIHFLFIHWSVVFIIFIISIYFNRYIPMPMYIFISILANNGTAALFIINCRKVYDGYLSLATPFFIFIAILQIFSILHCVAYFIVMFLENKQRKETLIYLRSSIALRARIQREDRNRKISFKSSTTTSPIRYSLEKY